MAALRKFAGRWWVAVISCLSATYLQACSVFAVASAPLPVDVSGFRPGMPRDYVQAKVGAPETTMIAGTDKATCDVYNLPTKTHGVAFRAVWVVVAGAADVFFLFVPEIVATPLSTIDDGMRMVTFCYDTRGGLLREAEGAPGIVAHKDDWGTQKTTGNADLDAVRRSFNRD